MIAPCLQLIQFLKSSSSQQRNFLDLECSVAVLYAPKPLGEDILRIKGYLASTLNGPIILRMPSP